MKTFAVADILRAVKIVIDENQTSESLLSVLDSDTLAMNEIIETQIPVAASMVELEAPRYKIGGGEAMATSIVWRKGAVGIGSGKVILPDDFLRLVVFQMSDWERPVVDAISDADPLYMQQFSRFAGIRGTPQKPIAALCAMPAGLCLEFFSCKDGEDVTVAKARYIPKPIITEKKEIRLCSKLYDSIVYRVAHLVVGSYGANEKAAQYLETSMNLMV